MEFGILHRIYKFHPSTKSDVDWFQYRASVRGVVCVRAAEQKVSCDRAGAVQ